MGVRDDQLQPIDTFSGLNNRDKESSVPANTLREAVDVDLTNAGKIQSRQGYTAPLIPCDLGHSLWADDLFPFGLYVDGENLHAVHPDLRTELLRSGLSPGLPVSYARVNDTAFWSNELQCGMVDAMGDAMPWACEQPAGQPFLQAIDGTLGKGQVLVCITFADRRRRESGATLAASIDIADGQGVLLMSLPQPSDPVETPEIRIYVSSGDDRALYFAQSVPAGTPSVRITTPPQGRLIATQFLSAMPSGHIVRQWNGRQLVARGKFVLWSEPLRYGLTHLGNSHVGFRDRITLMEPVEGDGAGVYVSDGKRVHFLAGANPYDWAPKPVSAYGAVPGSSMVTPASAWGIESKQLVPAWLGTDGLFTVGLPGGNVVTFNQSQFTAPAGDRAASLFREQDGIMQFITAQRGAMAQSLGVTDTAVATVYRAGDTP
jgi:hypothetical protein